MDKIKIVFEDQHLIVLNKPAGILVHPTPAGERNTVVDFLKKHIFKPLPHPWGGVKGLNWPDPTRPGIVHRLDKDTSGLIVVAKSPEILSRIQKQFKKRQVKKKYLTLVLGRTPKKGRIKTSISRSKNQQKTQIINFAKTTARPAVTLYQTKGYYSFASEPLSLVEVSPQTGRMHQIRVHLKSIGHPVIGDPLYNNKLARKISREFDIHRQFLHASKLQFQHPISKEIMSFESHLPAELQDLLAKLEKV